MVNTPRPDAQPSTDHAASSGTSGTDRLRQCEERIEYTFTNKRLLKASLTHASGADHRLASNERLEFLGDAVLGAIVCELLYKRFPELLEGDLTKIKSVVVSRHTCTKISEALGLKEFLIVGKGMAANQDVPPSVLSDVFESLLAAIFLDGGNEAARDFVKKHIGPEIDLAASGDCSGNYKSLLQQYAQREHGTTPLYQLQDEEGPDHAKRFQVCVVLDGQRYPGAWGTNKKEAEQRAAQNALAQINNEKIPFADSSSTS
jgi:ribonuclease-3